MDDEKFKLGLGCLKNGCAFHFIIRELLQEPLILASSRTRFITKYLECMLPSVSQTDAFHTWLRVEKQDAVWHSREHHLQSRQAYVLGKNQMCTKVPWAIGMPPPQTGTGSAT